MHTVLNLIFARIKRNLKVSTANNFRKIIQTRLTKHGIFQPRQTNEAFPQQRQAMAIYSSFIQEFSLGN
jgi:hypothetical protein